MITSLELLATTAFIAVTSSLLSVAFGIPLGSWLRTLHPEVARVFSSLSLVPFLLPPLLIGLSAIGIFGEQNLNSDTGMFAIIIAHVIMNFGFIAKVFAGSTIDSDQVAAARIDGASDRKIRRLIELPQQLPGLSSAALLIALYSATSFGLVITLGAGNVKTLETEISAAALQRLDLESAGLYAVLQTLLTLSMFVVSRSQNVAPSALDQIEPSPLKADFLERLVSFVLLGIVLLGLAALVTRSLTGAGLLGNLVNLASKGERQVLNITVLDAGLNSMRNSIVVVLIAVPLAYLLASRKRSAGWVLIPIGISPVVVGLATLAVTGYLPRELTSSWVLLPLVQVLFALPVAYQILRPARLALDQELLEASRLDGAGLGQRILSIELPILRKSLSLAIAFSAMVSIGEFGAASFLAFGSNETLPIVLFKLLGRPGEQNLGMAMTVAAIYILISAYVIWLTLKPAQTPHRFSAAAR